MKPLFGTPLNRSHPLSYGLTGCWLLNEGAGPRAYDSSGCGNHGTLSGFSDPPSGSNGWAPGPHGGGLGYDFTTVPYINLGSSSTLYPGYGSLTVEAVVLNRDYAYPRSSLPCGRSAVYLVGNFGWTLDDLTSSGVFARIRDADNVKVEGVLPIPHTTNAWKHITVVFDRSLGRCIGYLDGRPVGYFSISTVTGNVLGNATISVGNSSGWRLDGVLGHLRIWQRALSAPEISMLYAQPYCMFEPPENVVSRPSFNQQIIRELTCSGM